MPSKYDKDLFAGGAGAGISIKPEGFLVISPDGNVKMVTVDSGNDPVNSAISAVPTIVEKIQNIMAKKKTDKSETDSEISLSD